MVLAKHRSLAMTMRYTHADRSAQVRAIKGMRSPLGKDTEYRVSVQHYLSTEDATAIRQAFTWIATRSCSALPIAAQGVLMMEIQDFASVFSRTLPAGCGPGCDLGR